jgi:glypican 4 (K-glypican)
VFTGCGKPVLGRRKRSNGELNFETLQFNTNGKINKKQQQQQQQQTAEGLEKVLRETKARLKDTKHFWQKLPYHMCGMVAEEKESCWNGEKKDK